MAPAGSIWDHKADKDLLLAIIAEGQLKGIIWPTVSAKMQAKGYTFTKEACRQHFQKIRKEADGGASPTRNSDPKPAKNVNSANSTPRKRKAMNDSFVTSNGSFGNGNAYEDDDEVMITPLKRKRVAKAEGMDDSVRNAPVFKVEGQGMQHTPIDLEQEDLYDGYGNYEGADAYA